MTIALRDAGWTAGGAGWPVAVVLAVAAVGAWLLARTGDLAAAAVFLWVYAAIYAAQGGGALAVALGAGAAAFVAAAALGARRYGPWPTARAA